MWGVLVILYCLMAACLHAGLARLKPEGNRVQQFLLAGGASGLGLLFNISRLHDITPPEWLAAIAVYAFACELYIFLFTFVTSSVSVALLLGEKEAVTVSTNTRGMVEQRLTTMVAAGLLDRKADRFQLTARSRLMVAVYQILRRFFRHDVGQ